jgi:hypothetical protein
LQRNCLTASARLRTDLFGCAVSSIATPRAFL